MLNGQKIKSMMEQSGSQKKLNSSGNGWAVESGGLENRWGSHLLGFESLFPGHLYYLKILINSDNIVIILTSKNHQILSIFYEISRCYIKYGVLLHKMVLKLGVKNDF